MDRSGFDTAFTGLRGIVEILEQLALEPPIQSSEIVDNVPTAPPAEKKSNELGAPIEQPRPLASRRSISGIVAATLATLIAVVGVAIIVSIPKVPNSAEQPGDGPSTPFSPGPTPPQPYKTQAFSSEPGPNAVVSHADRPTFPMVGDGLDKWCAQAELPSSIAICSDPELRALVIERQHAFDQARSRLSRDRRKALLADQNSWVRSYPRICGLADAPPSLPLAPTIKDCMAQAGRARIAYLKAYGGTSPASTETGPARIAENSPPVQPETVSKQFRCRDPNTNFVYERSEPCARGDVTLSGPPSISNEQAAQSREPEQPTQNWQDWDGSSGQTLTFGTRSGGRFRVDFCRSRSAWLSRPLRRIRTFALNEATTT